MHAVFLTLGVWKKCRWEPGNLKGILWKCEHECVWRVAAKSKCGPSNVLQMCFICINCPHSCSSFRVYLHTLSVLTLQFRLSYLKLCLYAHECQWRGIFWMLAVIFFLPCTHSDTPVMFLKNWLTKKTLMYQDWVDAAAAHF